LNIEIRRGRADDATFLARILLSSSRAHLARGVWDLIVGSDDEGCLEYLRRLVTAEPRSLYHYEYFRVAEIEGSQAAALAAFPLAPSRWRLVSEALNQVQHDLGWTKADLTASQQRTAPIWSCFLEDAGADWGIENVAVLPQFRKQGAVDRLLRQTVEDARQQGFKLAQVSTYIGNDQAIAVYERVGFRFSDEKRCETLETALGTPGFVRLLLPLSL
jgi:GNAT superfamily N-acetyltransferase